MGRYEHCISVLETATMLAGKHGVDPGPLRLAALLHDCAREYPHGKLLSQCEEWGLEVRDVDRKSPVLLHGKLAVEIARRDLGLTVPEVVSAVRWHTAGHPDMSLSDKLFYLSDVAEPTNSFDWVTDLRALAMEDVDGAMLMAIGINIEHLDRTGRVVDPDTYLLLDLLQSR